LPHFQTGSVFLYVLYLNLIQYCINSLCKIFVIFFRWWAIFRRVPSYQFKDKHKKSVLCDNAVLWLDGSELNHIKYDRVTHMQADDCTVLYFHHQMIVWYRYWNRKIFQKNQINSLYGADLHCAIIWWNHAYASWWSYSMTLYCQMIAQCRSAPYNELIWVFWNIFLFQYHTIIWWWKCNIVLSSADIGMICRPQWTPPVIPVQLLLRSWNQLYNPFF
jgi:hypothetical protein